MGEARRTTPKVLGCTADKMLPRACQTNSSPAEQWFPPQAAHLAAFPFFQAASSLPGSPFPQAASQGQPGAISLGYQITFSPMSALFLSPHNDPSHQFSVSSLTATSLL